MRALAIWASGVSLIATFACGLFWGQHSTLPKPQPYFINLPGLALLCVDGGPGPGIRIISCSPTDMSSPTGEPPSIQGSYERTSPGRI